MHACVFRCGLVFVSVTETETKNGIESMAEPPSCFGEGHPSGADAVQVGVRLQDNSQTLG